MIWLLLIPLGYLILGCIIAGVLKRYSKETMWEPIEPWEWTVTILLWWVPICSIVGDGYLVPGFITIWQTVDIAKAWDFTFVKLAKWIGGEK